MLEKKYQQLNPEERARVASSGFWKIADTFAEGKDITEQQRKHDRFIRNYVDTLPDDQFSNYLENLSKCDTTEWGKRYFSAYNLMEMPVDIRQSNGNYSNHYTYDNTYDKNW